MTSKTKMQVGAVVFGLMLFLSKRGAFDALKNHEKPVGAMSEADRERVEGNDGKRLVRSVDKSGAVTWEFQK